MTDESKMWWTTDTLYLHFSRQRESDQRTIVAEFNRVDQRLDDHRDAVRTALQASQRNSGFIIAGVGVLIAAFMFFMKR